MRSVLSCYILIEWRKEVQRTICCDTRSKGRDGVYGKTITRTSNMLFIWGITVIMKSPCFCLLVKSRYNGISMLRTLHRGCKGRTRGRCIRVDKGGLTVAAGATSNYVAGVWT